MVFAMSDAPSSKTILVVDDEKAARFALRRVFEKEFRVLEAETGEAALSAVERERPDLLVMDINMPGITGLDALARLRERDGDRAPPVLMLTAHGNERIAVEAMKRGAVDYLAKPYDVDELRIVARRALAVRALEKENAQLRTAVRTGTGLSEILGASEPMRRLAAVIARVAPLDATVLIEGESGTGKELVARELHRLSPRAGKPFVAVNCAALPESLMESELFGHEKGAFTGALGTRKGCFERASGGTLFLDEIGEAPPALQAKLLRVLETRKLERVGGADTVEVDVRLVAATNKDLRAQAKAGNYREDLYFRLKVIDLALPPLRARTGDTTLLARHFAEVSATRYGLPARPLSRAAIVALESYPWPGNVRELLHVVEKAAILAAGPRIEPEDLPQEVVSSTTTEALTAAAAEEAAAAALTAMAGTAAPLAHAPAPAPVPGRPATAERAENSSPTPSPSEEDVDAPDAGDLAAAALAEAEAGTPFAEAKRRAMARFETELVSRELVRARGNVSKTARALGLHRQSLQHKLKELGIDAARFRDDAGAATTSSGED